MDESCRVYWGSHGCSLERGHAGLCVCSCCDCPPGHHDGVTAPEEIGEPGVYCVAQPPYYGATTRFYGEDVEARGLPHVRDRITTEPNDG